MRSTVEQFFSTSFSLNGIHRECQWLSNSLVVIYLYLTNVHSHTDVSIGNNDWCIVQLNKILARLLCRREKYVIIADNNRFALSIELMKFFRILLQNWVRWVSSFESLLIIKWSLLITLLLENWCALDILDVYWLFWVWVFSWFLFWLSEAIPSTTCYVFVYLYICYERRKL